MQDNEVILKVEGLTKYFPIGGRLLERPAQLHAVENMSFEVQKGRTIGIVGESGSGKSTVARLILKLIPATGGRVIYEGQDILPLNPYSRPGTPLETIDGVVVHYVGNPGTSAAANRSFFANLALTHETYASAHFIVGLEGEVLQCVPLAEIAYCSSQANDHTVSIEVCHADEAGEFSAETMASLLRLTAWLCEEFDLAPADVIRHYDVTGKVCPKYYVDHPEAWEDFRYALRAAHTQENPS